MTKKERFNINGKNLLNKVKELVNEGNITSISISDKNDRQLCHFPLTVGVIAAVLAPMLAAVGALAIFVGECTLTVERDVLENENEPMS